MMRGTVRAGGSGSQAVHKFSLAPQANIPRSSFNRSHGVKTTFNEGFLIPILADEMLPGDTFNLRMHAFARMATPIFPIMDNLYLESFFFAVPYRLVWDHWENFNGANIPNTYSSTDYTVPQLTTDGTSNVANTIFDYFGIPNNISGLNFNSLHLRAYNLIYNDWFRDENLQNSVTVNLGDTGDNLSDFTILRRGKRHDYFTSCLPFPQKGPDVLLPLGQSAPIIFSTTTAETYWRDTGDHTTTYPGTAVGNATIGGQVVAGPVGTPVATIAYDPNGTLEADLTDASAATINDIRLAFQTQKLYEKDARGGSRYVETIFSHFHVQSPDFRLQRSEYLGGGSTPILVNPVAQTSPTSGGNALGQLAAYGVAVAEGHGFTYSATEHMLLIGLVMVRADINYQQGLNRMWSRQTRLDYYWPVFSHLGEQAVLNQEIYAQGTSDDQGVFGYQERYAEMRYKPSLVTGLFNSTAAGTLDPWHLAQKFATLPTLNSTFIQENAPMTRILAVNTQPHFLFDCQFTYICARPMPVYAVPGLVDHF